MNLNSFKCEKCGECCRHIDLVPGLSHLQTNGVCRYLKNDICIIYNSRPDLCNRFKVFEMLKDQMTEEEFVEKLVYYCEKFKKMKVNHDKT